MNNQNDSIQKVEKQNKRIIWLLVIIAVLLIAVLSAIVTISIISDGGKADTSFSEVRGKRSPEDKTEDSTDNMENPSVQGGIAPNQPITDADGNNAAPNTVPDNQGGAVQPAPEPSEKDDSDTLIKPQDGVQTLKYYNDVINRAVNSEVGYQKSRLTDNEKMDGSAALQAMKDLVYQFMGIGAANIYYESAEKGKWGDIAFLTKSRLEAGDVTGATCVEDGSNYVITINLKSGVSNATQSSNKIAPTSALDKCGICVGAEDKGYFDHKTASVIYDAIDDIYPTAEIKETYTNAKVIATVDAKTGNLIKLVVEWTENVTLSKLLGMSATASGVCHVTYTNFKY